MSCRYGSADDAPALESRDSGLGQRRSVVVTIAAASAAVGCPTRRAPSARVGVPGRRRRALLPPVARAGEAPRARSPAESDLAFAEAATRLRGPQAGAAVTYGPCISKQGCDQPANGKSRLCGIHLDALLDRLGA